MLSSDPILSVHCREHLPTDDEVRKTSLLLASRPSLQEAFERTVRIANDTYATLERWIFVTKVEGHCGDDVAIQTVEALEKCLEARRRLSMDSILRHPPFDHTFLQLFTKVLPLGFHGVTRDGNPVVIIRYGAVDTTRLSDLWQRGQAQAIDGANAFTMCFIRCVPEYVTRVLMFDESLRQGRTVDRIVAVIDVGGVGRNHWQNCFLRFVQQYVQFSGPIYPEIITRIYITTAPWIVSNVCWPVIKKFLTKVQGMKVSILDARQTAGTMPEVVRSDMLPPFLGGTCACRECARGALRDGGSMARWERQMGAPWRRALSEDADAETRDMSKSSKTWRCCGCIFSRSGAKDSTLVQRKRAETDHLDECSQVLEEKKYEDVAGDETRMLLLTHPGLVCLALVVVAVFLVVLFYGR
eukprot:TRINITY_DN12259_c0_g1_i1.p1 TRINITY_DN12259_c0_g1~~TRINITY_DN12259_c0_g1_i1.p1  ORF type:complete len:412 (-),score=41.33 TRINITY_DN12259_c0_g1_i1:29-1264(-)